MDSEVVASALDKLTQQLADLASVVSAGGGTAKKLIGYKELLVLIGFQGCVGSLRNWVLWSDDPAAQQLRQIRRKAGKTWVFPIDKVKQIYGVGK